MATVGERLRGERERQKLTVHQVADGTNIKTDHIRALEDGKWSAFSAPVYIRGFTRTYARYLRLDDKALVAELDAELGRTADYSGPPSLVPQRKGPLDTLMLVLSRVRWRLVFPILVGLSVLGVVLWGVQWWKTRPKRDPLAGLGNGLYQPRPANRPAMLPLPPPPTNAPPAVPPAGRRPQ
jgi:cytoskeletal protein RodZ